MLTLWLPSLQMCTPTLHSGTAGVAVHLPSRQTRHIVLLHSLLHMLLLCTSAAKRCGSLVRLAWPSSTTRRSSNDWFSSRWPERRPAFTAILPPNAAAIRVASEKANTPPTHPYQYTNRQLRQTLGTLQPTSVTRRRGWVDNKYHSSKAVARHSNSFTGWVGDDVTTEIAAGNGRVGNQVTMYNSRRRIIGPHIAVQF